ncbi:P-loop ATPase, Sll1717 family [Methylophilus sp. Leaf414]|uniref:P-loop ATPase, Sll1717 family n=1 Tax=Methylophilus sp. Leaf414 TaxID=1736371 RepID=UPI0006F94F27|nr:hypothetical protein [Methylophilus sp. Leaf414]KQT36707.1 hypothetical protein ASG24_06060 [Methylophilus sp. Leaf414]
MTNKQKSFVAYTGRDEHLAKLISDSVSKANSKSTNIRYETWEFNDIPGNPLISPIIEGIGDSSFIVADITYLNPNVVYEIGFAIARRKRAFLIRHQPTEGDKSLVKEVGIFDTLGYLAYRDESDLVDRLTSFIDPTCLQIDEALDRKAPVYIVVPQSTGDAETVMVSKIKKARFRYRSFNPVEDSRLSGVDAIRQVASSSGVLVCLQNDSTEGSRANNVRALFVAGLSHGLGKPTLILSPIGYQAPLDIMDETKFYRYPEDINEHIANLTLDITEYQQQVDPTPIKFSTKLQSLRIGDPTAENEMTTLSNYYLQIDQYRRALQGDVNLVVGRKGSGKTALFIQVRDRIRNNKTNIVVDLKPEGYQLLKIKEDILNYLSEGTRQHLITAFWEYLLLLEVAHKLLEKDKHTYKHNHLITQLYIELEDTYRITDLSTEGDFSERLLALSQRLVGQYQARFGGVKVEKLTSEQVTELIYVHDLRLLRERISSYLEQKQAVWILFDNLDKGWSTHGVDDVDVTVLRCLINAGRIIERDMRKGQRTVHCIVFVRNDVYEHLMANSADYGKEMRAVLDWTEPDLLREMLRLRLVAGLEEDASDADLSEIIPKVAISHYRGNEIVDYMIERSLMRPRNLLKIFSHCRGFASNFNHSRIEEGDVEKGFSAYSQDLLLELDKELTDVFPTAKDFLYHFLDASPVLNKDEIFKLFQEAGIDGAEYPNLLNFLLYYGVIGLNSDGEITYIFDINYDLRKLNIRIERSNGNAIFCINPAFWPSLNIREKQV